MRKYKPEKWTYLQTGYPNGTGKYSAIESMFNSRSRFPNELQLHAEFGRGVDGEVALLGIPLLKFTTKERLYEIISWHERNNIKVFNPHTYEIEAGGMKKIDLNQLKRKMNYDPKGLLNPGKMAAWFGKENQYFDYC